MCFLVVRRRSKIRVNLTIISGHFRLEIGLGCLFNCVSFQEKFHLFSRLVPDNQTCRDNYDSKYSHRYYFFLLHFPLYNVFYFTLQPSTLHLLDIVFCEKTTGAYTENPNDNDKSSYWLPCRPNIAEEVLNESQK